MPKNHIELIANWKDGINMELNPNKKYKAMYLQDRPEFKHVVPVIILGEQSQKNCYTPSQFRRLLHYNSRCFSESLQKKKQSGHITIFMTIVVILQIALVLLMPSSWNIAIASALMTTIMLICGIRDSKLEKERQKAFDSIE